MEDLALFPEKRISEADLPSLAVGWRKAGMSVVFADGCFDPVCADLVGQLRDAGGEGDVLVVGVYPDGETAKRLGPPHPLVEESGRVTILAAMEFVDAVAVIPDGNVKGLLAVLKPDRHVPVKESSILLK
ncbi:MAG: hypothetical protein ABIH66_00255 [bacterium]